MRLRTWLAALALLGGAEGSAAAEPGLDLAWNAPPGCPDRAWVVAAVNRLVPSPPQALHVTGAVREDEGGFTVDLELSGPASGTRTLRAASCTSVARGAALIIALALDPQAATSAIEEAPPAPAPAPPLAPAASAPPAPRREALAFAGAVVIGGLLPTYAPGAVVGGGVAWRALRLDLSAELVPHASTSLARRPAVGADFALAGLALRGCAGHAWGGLAVHGCAAVRAARISGEGRGLVETYRDRADLLALEPGVLVRVPLGTRAGLALDAAAVLPLTRPDFVLLTNGPSEPLHRVSVVGLRAALTVDVRF